jgi:hypothetical protein
MAKFGDLIMTTKQFSAGACCAVALVLGMGTANASLLSLTGGTSRFTPATNDVIGPGVEIFDNAVLATTANNVRLDWFFWGNESGATNTLWVDGGAASNTEGANNAPPPVLFPGFGSPWTSYVQATAGAVDMYFTSTIFGGNLTPGGGDALKSIAFNFLDDNGAAVSGPTNLVGFYLDDSGAGPDDDFDDYVGYAKAVVPIPAAVWLFGSALLGMVGIGTRRARKV